MVIAEDEDWTTKIKAYLTEDTLPEDPTSHTHLRQNATKHTILDGVLYRRDVSIPLLHCLRTPKPKNRTMEKVH